MVVAAERRRDCWADGHAIVRRRRQTTATLARCGDGGRQRDSSPHRRSSADGPGAGRTGRSRDHTRGRYRLLPQQRRNPNVQITVSLDGVAGAHSADEAMKLLLVRAETIPNSDWKLIQSSGYGTAWEMVKLRTAVRLGDRNWRSIEWRMWNPETKKYDVVEPERFRYPNGELVPDE
ncbi:polymorphic toxin type 27 domain-containing protein [Streptomyces sp. NPDC093990]|uniref:polymorphic toxin type 27 domain-containing protein n=1 Tax=Streptomyces sp. NPDC093990 TaxID=3155306 RepID=UPI00341A5698